MCADGVIFFMGPLVMAASSGSSGLIAGATPLNWRFPQS
jgi:hypothetical protein